MGVVDLVEGGDRLMQAFNSRSLDPSIHVSSLLRQPERVADFVFMLTKIDSRSAQGPLRTYRSSLHLPTVQR